jgi:hypothetical protein
LVTVLLILGGLCFLIGWVWLLVAAFVESVPWGVGTFFFWPIALVFSFFNWPEYKVPTFMMVGGFCLFVLGRILV